MSFSNVHTYRRGLTFAWLVLELAFDAMLRGEGNG